MNPKKKANILVEKFYQKAPEVMGTGRAYEYAQEMAIVLVEEILDARKVGITGVVLDKEYWEEVLECINNL